jgi:glycosyltransferase involved in cell wall biosynthesis
VTAPRIAVACSGLGHVQRGIESWASDLAQALAAAGADVTLFGGAPGPGLQALPTLRRTGHAAIALAHFCRQLGGWRYGMGSPYDVEQTSFAWTLWHRIRRGYDIVHVQDPTIALWLERAWRAGRSGARVIYANGTGAGPDVMRRFHFLQLLTSSAAQAWAPQQPPDQRVFLIPNFIDTSRFTPGDQAAARVRFGLPADRPILLTCAAIRRFHKRIDVLLRAFGAATRGTNALLVVAGGHEADTDALIAEGSAVLGDRVRFLPNLPRDAMPDLYRAADAFVLASLFEMFGIVLLEALATGLPVLCNDTPDFRDIAGPAGLYADLAQEPAFAAGIADLLRPAVRAPLAAAGRAHVQAAFSASAVAQQMLAMYRAVCAA